jgi:hypothetical protein
VDKHRSQTTRSIFRRSNHYIYLIALFSLLVGLVPGGVAYGQVTDLASADFNSNADGFFYADDTFDTGQPNYAAGQRVSTGGYNNSGALQVTLGGVDNNAISGMSGGWQYTLNLPAGASGVTLTFRYKLQQSATYEFDEFSRVLVTVDGVRQSRGAKDYIDHVGGDGTSGSGNGPGNMNVFIPTTEWQQHDAYVGDLAAGTHTFVIGAYNNGKTASNEVTTLWIDDVSITSGNQAPTLTAAQTLVSRTNQAQYLAQIQNVAQYGDRCRLSGCSSTSYFNALSKLESDLQALGYTTVRHNSNSIGTSTTNLYATKVGSTTPTEMYMLSAHLDGRGGGTAFNDDASGVAVVMEAARVFAGADVVTDKSIRFIFWDNEESGYRGARNYVADKRSLQGTVDEPTWLGLITHDMVLFDHGAIAPGQPIPPNQSVYADLDVEWHNPSNELANSRNLANAWRYASGLYATDYPASAWDYSYYTDDNPFWDVVASVSVRENRRILDSQFFSNIEVEESINPYYHTSGDVEANHSEADIRLGFNAAQITIGTVAELVGAEILGSNNEPSADDDSATTKEDTAVTIDVLDGDTDPDNDALSVLSVGAAANGTVVNNGSDVTYTPAANFNGSDSFTYTVTDGRGGSASANVTVTIDPINDAPDAVDDVAATTSGATININVLANDSDPENNPLTISAVSDPPNGTVTTDGSTVNYTSYPGYVSAGTMDYVDDPFGTNAPNYASGSIQSGAGLNGASAGAIVTLGGIDTSIVNGMSGGWQGSFTGTGQTLELTFSYILTIDSDYESDEYGEVRAYLGSTQLNIPTPSQINGDGNGGSDQTTNWQTTTIDLGSPFGPQELTIGGFNNKKTYNNEVTEVRIDDVRVVDASTGASLLEVTFDGNGADTFTYTVSDGNGGSDTAQVSVSVEAGVVSLNAVDDIASTDEDQTAVIAVLANDSGVNSITVVSDGAQGSVVNNGDGTVTYTPNANYNGADSFTYAVDGVDGGTDSATVSITVNPVNDSPVANDDTATTDEDVPVVISVLTNDTDVDGDPLTVASVNSITDGNAVDNGDGTITYTPAADFNGTATVNYTAGDGAGGTDSATATITVNPVTDSPVANDDAATTDEDVPVTVDVLGNDSYANAITDVSNGANGSVQNNGDGTVTYTPNADYNGLDSFTYTVDGVEGGADSATVTITVNPVNDSPVANDDAATTDEDVPVTVDVLGNDSYANAITDVSNGANGSIQNNGDGTVTYTPNANYYGADSFTYTVDGVGGGTDVATVSVTVNPVNDDPVAADDAATTDEGAPVIISVLANDNDVDGDPLTVSIVGIVTNGRTVINGDGSITYTPNAGFTGSDSFTYMANDGSGNSNVATVTITVNEPPAGGDVIYVSSTSGGSAGGVSFSDEDILAFDTGTGVWSMVLDGSDVGLSGSSYRDINAFHLMPDGSILLSFVGSTTIPDVGAIDDSDIVRFIPTSLGTSTAGTFELYFDGSDAGLTDSGEDIDGLYVLADGSIVISTIGSSSVPGAASRDEDLLHFEPTSLGANTSGTWTVLFDGSDVGLSTSTYEDVYGLWLSADSDIYLTTRGTFSVAGVSGDGADVFVCSPISTGVSTACDFSPYWDGSAMGYSSEVADGLHIDEGGVVTASLSQIISGISAANSEEVIDETESGEEDGDEDVDDAIFLPYVTQ